jgi:hypothetical protein
MHRDFICDITGISVKSQINEFIKEKVFRRIFSTFWKNNFGRQHCK